MKTLRAIIFIFLMLITTLSATRLPAGGLRVDSGNFGLHEIPLIGKFTLVDVGTYIDNVIAKIEDNSGSPIPLYYHSDRQFNVRGLTDSTGAVKELYAYSVYGKQIVMDASGVVLTGTAEDNNYGFTGRYLDDETGLWYFRARYFSDELGRFISRDPLGYVDGMSLYNGYFAVRFGLDPSGLSELSAAQYETFIGTKIRAGVTNFNDLWVAVLKHYLQNDAEDDWCWDCEDDMEEIFEAFYDVFDDEDGPADHGFGLTIHPAHQGDRSSVTHFFGGAAWEGFAELGDTAQDAFEYLGNHGGDWASDTAYAYAGADLSDFFDTWSEKACRDRVKLFTSGKVKFTDLLGPSTPVNTEKGIKDYRKAYRKRLKDVAPE